MKGVTGIDTAILIDGVPVIMPSSEFRPERPEYKARGRPGLRSCRFLPIP
jgi:hypothetical protein